MPTLSVVDRVSPFPVLCHAPFAPGTARALSLLQPMVHAYNGRSNRASAPPLKEALLAGGVIDIPLCRFKGSVGSIDQIGTNSALLVPEGALLQLLR